MQENAVRNIALICALAGLVLLYYASYTEPLPRSISRVAPGDMGLVVRVCGDVERKNTSNNHVFLELEDITGSISIVFFNSTALKLNESGFDVFGVSDGEEICVTGVVGEYPRGSGELEIIHRGGNIARV